MNNKKLINKKKEKKEKYCCIVASNCNFNNKLSLFRSKLKKNKNK